MTTDTNMATPIIDATTIRVTPTDRPVESAKADAVDQVLAPYVTMAQTVDARIRSRSESAVVDLAADYLSLSDILVKVIHHESQRKFGKRSGLAQSRLSRASTLGDAYRDRFAGRESADVVAEYIESLTDGTDPTFGGFRSWVTGKSSVQTPEQKLAGAVRSCRKAGMTDEQIMEVVEATLAQ